MVKLIWENKSKNLSKIEDLTNYFPNFFKAFENHSFKHQNSDYNHGINRLYWSDNLDVICYLLNNNFKGKIDLIYIDPPFFSGSNYQIEIESSDKEYIDIAYYDHWEKDLDSYLQMLYDRIFLIRKLLSNKGLLFIHLDWHASHYIRVILDEIFGAKRFVNNIVWYYYNKYSAGKRNLPRAHDDILIYSKTENYTFNPLRIPRKKPRKQLMREMKDGVLKNIKDENGQIKYRIVTDKKVDDVWKIPCMQPASREWSGFPTQKHHKLIERIIKLGSNERDLIADFFCGSGTSLVVAERLKRRWIGCDISKYSIYLTRNRILDYQNRTKNFCPFEINTNLDAEKRKIIKSGFFQKEISIKRKK
ncbi:MAG: DNA methyltransferase [Promethearchaeota archaeon]